MSISKGWEPESLDVKFYGGQSAGFKEDFMFLIRQATTNDLKGLKHLASVFNTVVPMTKHFKNLLEVSADSFSGKIESPGDRVCFCDGGSPDPAVGRNQYGIAQHGHRDAPHIFLMFAKWNGTPKQSTNCLSTKSYKSDFLMMVQRRSADWF